MIKLLLLQNNFGGFERLNFCCHWSKSINFWTIITLEVLNLRGYPCSQVVIKNRIFLIRNSGLNEARPLCVMEMYFLLFRFVEIAASHNSHISAATLLNQKVLYCSFYTITATYY